MNLFEDINRITNPTAPRVCECEPWQFYRENVYPIECWDCGSMRKVNLREFIYRLFLRINAEYPKSSRNSELLKEAENFRQGGLDRGL